MWFHSFSRPKGTSRGIKAPEGFSSTTAAAYSGEEAEADGGENLQTGKGMGREGGKKKLVFVCFGYVKRVTKTYKNLSDQISLLAKEVNVCVGSGFRPRIPRFFHPFLTTTLLWGPLVRKGI